MKTQKITPLTFLVILSMIILPACSGTSALAKQNANGLAPAPVQAAAPAANPTPAAPVDVQPGLLSSYEGTLENIYTQVNPSVVNIQVVDQQSAPSFNSPFFGFPGQQQNTPQFSQALGSGFVWDTQGDIVTNNHVIDGATQIQVSFSDGTTVPATVVGTDVNSDLAVIKVNVPASMLQPVQMADSGQTRVGQLAIAIGSPFGNQGTMTVGIISAIGRSLPVNQTTAQGASYTIPDVIQTDAPINPGNSGGVLLNDQGQVVGVTAAIESPTQANAGIGYAIPSEIVQKVIPSLISSGHYDHPYLGISGTTLTLDLANAMKLSSDQRGALVEQIVPNGPADKAGLQGSNQQVTINGLNVPVGGDVITAIDGQPVKTMDDVIAYLTDHTEVGQKVTLTILRNGKEMSLDVTLQARPSQNNITSTTPQTANNQVRLGIVGLPVDSLVAQSMGLPANQQGVLVERVDANSPAEQAGLQGSTQPATIQGQEILVGGDIILKLDNQPVTQVPELASALQQYQPGDQVQLTILRNGSQMQLNVTLAAQ